MTNLREEERITAETVPCNFNKLVVSLIKAYEKFHSTQQQQPQSNRDCMMIDSEAGKDTASTKTTTTEANQASQNWEQFLVQFDFLAEFVHETKRENFTAFVGLFQQRVNLTTIQFYEFINRMLNVHHNDFKPAEANSEYLTIHRASTVEIAPETKAVIVSRALEILNVLTSNQNYENADEDEASIMCCDMLATSFNFTSSIARLLLTSINRPCSTVNNKSNLVAANSNLTLSETNFKIAFNVLNKLTANNKLFGIDAYVKQLVLLIVNKIVSADIQQAHIQFLSNVIRNDTAEIENIIRSSNQLREFFRRIVQIFKEKTNKNLTLNALTILVKFNYEDMFTVIWPISREQQQQQQQSKPAKTSSSRISNFHSFQPTLANLLVPVDFAMSELCAGGEEMSHAMPSSATLSLDKRTMHSSKFLLVNNSINFLLEAIRCEPVRRFLENHDDYTNLFLFRLNQYLVENKLCANVRLALSVSTKIVKIFTTLSDHSDRMASKLFQMIFNTPRFVEGEGQCSADIATRLKNLILSSSSTNGSSTLTRKKTTANANATADANKYNVIINYFLRVCDLNTLTGNGYSSSKANTGSSKVISEKQQAENALSAHINFCKNSNFVLSLLQFLINLFKKCDSNNSNNHKNYNEDLSHHVELLYSKLACNVDFLQKLISFKNANRTADDMLCIEPVYFYNLALMDTILKTYKVNESESEQLELAQSLLGSLNTANEWTRSPDLAMRSLAYTELWQSAAICVISLKLCTRLCFFDPKANKFVAPATTRFREATSASVKADTLSFLGRSEFLQALAFLANESDDFLVLIDQSHVHKSFAYEFLFDLHDISRLSEFNYNFLLQNFLNLGEKLKRQKNMLVSSVTKNSSSSFSSFQNSKLVSEASSNNHHYQAKTDNVELNQLFEFYELKLAEQRHQEQLLMNMLNQHYASHLLHEIESKNLREQLRVYAQRELEIRHELSALSTRQNDSEAVQRDLASSNDKLRGELEELRGENAALCGQAEEAAAAHAKLRLDFEASERENEECVKSMQDIMATEAAAKKELAAKFKECFQKLNSAEQQKTAVEAKRKELETQLESGQAELAKTAASLAEVTEANEKLKQEHEKLKAILSYVKENYKS